MRDNKSCVFTPVNKVGFSQLHRKCLIIHRQEIRQEVHQDVCIPQLDEGGKYHSLVGSAFMST